MTRYSVHGENQIARADLFAFAAHSAIGQVRKYTGEPYISHPREVAGMVQSLPNHTWQQVVLALLHDVVEDTQVTLAQVQQEFGREIRNDLWYLTNVTKTEGNRARRHFINCERLRNSPVAVATVKVIDIKCNTRGFEKLNPTFAPQYFREKLEALDSLRHADPIVWRMTWEQIATASIGLGLVA